MTSITKILLALLLVWAWTRIWQVVAALLVSVILAVTFEPVAAWLERRRVPRWAAARLPVLLPVAGPFLDRLHSGNASSSLDR